VLWVFGNNVIGLVDLERGDRIFGTPTITNPVERLIQETKGGLKPRSSRGKKNWGDGRTEAIQRPYGEEVKVLSIRHPLLVH